MMTSSFYKATARKMVTFPDSFPTLTVLGDVPTVSPHSQLLHALLWWINWGQFQKSFWLTPERWGWAMRSLEQKMENSWLPLTIFLLWYSSMRPCPTLQPCHKSYLWRVLSLWEFKSFLAELSRRDSYKLSGKLKLESVPETPFDLCFLGTFNLYWQYWTSL